MPTKHFCDRCGSQINVPGTSFVAPAKGGGNLSLTLQVNYNEANSPRMFCAPCIVLAFLEGAKVETARRVWLELPEILRKHEAA